MFDADGNFVTQFGSAGFDPGQFDEPVGVAVDKNGTVYVVDTWNQRIQTFTRVEVEGSLTFTPDKQWDVFDWIRGIDFRNPVGLSGGFDKNGRLTDILPEVGFGFMEIGSITGDRCEGNPKPRMWRLKKSKSLLVHYGLNNRGARAIARRLQGKNFRIPVGINIAKTNNQETVTKEAGAADYLRAYREMRQRQK